MLRILSKLGVLAGMLVVLSLSGALNTPIALYGQPLACGGLSQKGFASQLLPSIPIYDFEIFSLPELNPPALLVQALSGFARGAQGSISIPIRRTTNSITGAVTTVYRTIILNQWSFLREGAFEVKLNGGLLPSVESPNPLLSLLGERAFRGGIEGYPNSLVALYIQQDRSINGVYQPGFISGFLLEDKDDPNKPWYFIEPLRPLLKMAVAPLYKNPGVSYTETDVDICFYKWRYAHIVYKAGNAIVGHPPSFHIDLDPVRHTESNRHANMVYTRVAPLQVIAGRFIPHDRQGRGVVVEVTTAQELQSLVITEKLPAGFTVTIIPSRSQTCAVTFIAPNVFDCKAMNLNPNERVTIAYQAQAGPTPDPSAVIEGSAESTAMDGQKLTFSLISRLDVVSVPPVSSAAINRTIPLVAVGDSDFYRLYTGIIKEKAWWEGQEEVLNLVGSFYSEKVPGLQFKVRALEAWRPLPLLPAEVGPSVSPGSTIPAIPGINAHSLLCHFAQGMPLIRVPHTDVRDPMVVHLFSGYNLRSLPSHTAIADFGGHICEDFCGAFGRDIVGLAEGIGGFRRPLSNSCSASVNPLMIPARFDPSAHHSLSQHSPKPNSSDPTAPNVNFSANLYQRFLLTAHEFGHNLGATHVDDDQDEGQSIMHSHLSNTIRFELHPISKGQIIHCLVSCP
jgi:hypothetical protein